MSGILIPMVKFAAAINSDEIVNVDQVQSVEKLDLPNGTQNQPGQKTIYTLLFTSKEVNSTTKDVSIRFVLEADRDAAHTAFLAATTATL